MNMITIAIFTDGMDEHDPTGRSNYLKLCDQLGVVPVSFFTRHIQDQEIIMRYFKI